MVCFSGKRINQIILEVKLLTTNATSYVFCLLKICLRDHSVI